MKYIGFVDYFIDEWHSNNYLVWVKELCKEKGLDIEIKYAWSEIETYEGKMSTDEWCKLKNIEKCHSLDELCEKSDYIMILAPANPEKHLEYAKTVLKYGKRTYIDKTFAPSLSEAESIYALGQKYDCLFFSTSALRYATELSEFGAVKGAKISGGGRSFEEYIVHQLEMLVKLMGVGVEQVKVFDSGISRMCVVKYHDGRTAFLDYFPKNGFRISVEDLDGTTTETQVESEYFKIMLDSILNFFINDILPFPKEETMEVIAIRDALLEGENRLDTWIKMK